MLITITTLGGAERLRWQVMEVPRVDVPFTSHLVVQAIAPDGALTGRSGSTLSDVGWHAFVWTTDGGTHLCKDLQSFVDTNTARGIRRCPVGLVEG